MGDGGATPIRRQPGGSAEAGGFQAQLRRLRVSLLLCGYLRISWQTENICAHSAGWLAPLMSIKYSKCALLTSKLFVCCFKST